MYVDTKILVANMFAKKTMFSSIKFYNLFKHNEIYDKTFAIADTSSPFTSPNPLQMCYIIWLKNIDYFGNF